MAWPEYYPGTGYKVNKNATPKSGEDHHSRLCRRLEFGGDEPARRVSRALGGQSDVARKNDPPSGRPGKLLRRLPACAKQKGCGRPINWDDRGFSVRTIPEDEPPGGWQRNEIMPHNQRLCPTLDPCNDRLTIGPLFRNDGVVASWENGVHEVGRFAQGCSVRTHEQQNPEQHTGEKLTNCNGPYRKVLTDANDR